MGKTVTSDRGNEIFFQRSYLVWISLISLSLFPFHTPEFICVTEHLFLQSGELHSVLSKIL
jgi:hypothetical protein